VQGGTVCLHTVLHFLISRIGQSICIISSKQKTKMCKHNGIYVKLNQTSDFFSNNTECRHCKILMYFGEEMPLCEDMCDVCTKKRVSTEAWDVCVAELAKLVINCLIELLPLRQTLHMHVCATPFSGSYGFCVS
jgi:superfamily II DNA helicase RecQ